MTTFDEALAEHGSAWKAIESVLTSIRSDYQTSDAAFYGCVSGWIRDNAAAIHQHQRGQQTDDLEARVKALEKNGGLDKRVRALEWKEASADARVEELARRIEALEDAPGPRPNAAEVSALRQRMDALTETLEKMQALDTSDVLTALVRDVALLKDYIIFEHYPGVMRGDTRDFRREHIGTEPQTPEARKMLGLSPQPVATPEPEPVYEWHGNSYRLAGNTKGLLCYGLDSVIGVAGQSCKVFDTEAAARSWVEAQIKTPKP